MQDGQESNIVFDESKFRGARRSSCEPENVQMCLHDLFEDELSNCERSSEEIAVLGTQRTHRYGARFFYDVIAYETSSLLYDRWSCVLSSII